MQVSVHVVEVLSYLHSLLFLNLAAPTLTPFTN
jgi:hypothetical protein